MYSIVESGCTAVAARHWDDVIHAGAVAHTIQAEVCPRDAVGDTAYDSAQVWVGIKRLHQ
jgi:hypothetical protein